MNTTKDNSAYSPSVNIKRDRRKSLSYIPTPNSKNVAKSILNGLSNGSKSITIIGAYGSGKSIFLWAFAKTLAQSRLFFDIPSNFELRKFHVINIIGEYRSIIETFTEEFQLPSNSSPSDILAALEEEYQKQEDKGKNLLIVLDEFGKFLEYAATHNPDSELYFIQRLAEFVNNGEKNLLFVTTLHQNFGAYSYQLNKHQRAEWSKVQGRFKEITFNEPVEQLLFLASESLNSLIDRKPRGFVPLFNAIKKSRSFPLRDYLTEDIAQKLYPLDILSASILTLALQKYGQNERSLFSFLENAEYKTFDNSRRSKFFSVANVYDYLRYSFSILDSKYNPHYIQWASINSSIERVEGSFELHFEEAKALVKTIGLLNIFGSNAMILDNQFLEEYGKRALGINNPKEIIDLLVSKKVLRYRSFNKRYVLFEGTDLDIDLAIDEAGNLVETTNNIADVIKEYFDFQIILAKSAYYKIGTPRFFQYAVSDDIIELNTTDEIDGYINLVFKDAINLKKVKTLIKKQRKPILYCIYENTTEVQNLLLEIKKVEKVIENNQEDRVAIRELKNILTHQKRLLQHYVLDAFSEERKDIRWIDFAGEHIIRSEKDLNRRISKICEEIYNKTPIFASELMNRAKLSGSIRTAQKKFIDHMINHYSKSDWGFSSNLFPPEKSIFYSLVIDKGIGKKVNENGFMFQKPSDSSFSFLWQESNQFLESTKAGKRSLRELNETLHNPPLKLKYGFLQFWLPLFLFIRRNDYALFSEDAYIPNLSKETLNLVLKYPHKYYVKAFQVEGVDLELFSYYRKLLQQEESFPSNESFIETIRPFLSLYKNLPNYSKFTKRLSSKAERVRDAIARAKDPEALFLSDLPTAMGTNKKDLAKNKGKAKEFIESLKTVINEIRTSYEALMERFSDHIKNVTGYVNLRENLEERYSKLQTSLLSQKQKSFYFRLVSDLDNNAWLSSISQSLTGKTLENLKDQDEPLLYSQFSLMLEELDNLIDLSKSMNDGNRNENIILIDIQSINKGRVRQVLNLSERKVKQVKKQKAAILSLLKKDKAVSLAAIAEILKELMDE